MFVVCSCKGTCPLLLLRCGYYCLCALLRWCVVVDVCVVDIAVDDAVAVVGRGVMCVLCMLLIVVDAVNCRPVQFAFLVMVNALVVSVLVVVNFLSIVFEKREKKK